MTISLAENMTLTAKPGANLGDSRPNIQVGVSRPNDKDVEMREIDGGSSGQQTATISSIEDMTPIADPGTNLGDSGLTIQIGTRPNDEGAEMQLHGVSGDMEIERESGGGGRKEVQEQVGKGDGLGESEGHNRESWCSDGEAGVRIKACGPSDGDGEEEHAATGNVENKEQIDKDKGRKVAERVGKGDAPEKNAERRNPKREIREKVVTPATTSFVPKSRKAAPSKYTTKLRAPRATTWPRDGDIFGQPIDLSVSIFFLLSCMSDALSRKLDDASTLDHLATPKVG